MTTGKPEAAAVKEAPRTVEQRMDALEGVTFELIDRVENLTKELTGFKKQAVTKPKGLFGGKRAPTPMKDRKTGIVYASKAALGKALGAEAGGDPLNTMVYYTVIKVLKMPDGSDRFEEANAEEAAKARAEYQAKIDAEVAEKNRQLEAEAEKSNATPAPTPVKQQQPKKK